MSLCSKIPPLKPVLSRRALLGLGLGGALGLLSGGCKRERKPKTTDSLQKRIIVVGAGIAGIAAARALKNMGHEVVVLEGRGRIGGRIYTDRREGLILEHGAQWIHGVSGNPLSVLAQQARLKKFSANFEDVEVFTPHGGRAQSTELEAMGLGYRALLNRVASHKGKDCAVAALLDALKLSPAHRQLVALVVQHSYAAELTDLSVNALRDEKGLLGGDVLLLGGIDTIVNDLAQGIEIRTRQVVKEIDSGASVLKVQTKAGKVLTADRVLVTVPLGVLKSTGGDASIRFTPSLPTAKQKAIEDSGVGVINKVMLEFKKPFWSKKHQFLGIMSAKTDTFGIFLNHLHFDRQNARVLTAFCSGSFAMRMEGERDAKIVDALLQTLRAVSGVDLKRADVLSHCVTRWGGDPFSLGSYSYHRVGKGALSQALAAPVAGRLFFAGEACSEYSSTMHGAYLSGLRAARQIGTTV